MERDRKGNRETEYKSIHLFFIHFVFEAKFREKISVTEKVCPTLPTLSNNIFSS